MTSAYTNQPIAPKTSKPQDYTDYPIIQKSIEILDSTHHEFDVSRVALLIFGHYFPSGEGWAVVPEFREEGGKRPDYIIEKFRPNAKLMPKQQFVPHIAVELKSGKGKTLVQALNQSVESMIYLVGDLGEDFTIFILIARGKTLGFFEYHNDRSNLYEDSVRHHRGAIPFNHPQQLCPPGRPTYTGTNTVPYEDEYAGAEENLEDMERAFLDVEKDSVTIQNVLRWMGGNQPLSGPV